jgi:hypothetical protein
MKLYLVDGEDTVHRVGPYQTLIILAKNPTTVREVVERERDGFRIDRIDFVREHPQLKRIKQTVVARITSPTPMLI